jgi:hypothetical protein
VSTTESQERTTLERTRAAETGQRTLFDKVRGVLPFLIALGILGALVVNCSVPLSNTDTYFHLRFGQEFLSGNWSLRHPGSVSTFATREWVPTQWLSEIVMAKDEQWFGLSGVAWLSGLLEVAFFATLYFTARVHADPIAVAPLIGVGLYACQDGLSMRPQVISYLLVGVVIGAWLRTRQDARIRWWLIPLTWLWAMLHGMWPIAILISLVAVVGMALDRAPRRQLVKGLAVTAGSAVAAALTPVGPVLYGAVVVVNSRGKYFSEWGSPSYTSPPCLALGALLVVTAVAMWKRSHNSWTEILLVVLASGFAVYSWRTVPVAGVMAAMLATGPVQDLLPRRTPRTRRETGLIAGACVAALALLALIVPHTASEPPSEPSWVAPTLSHLPAGTKVVNDWAWGGYFMWRFPQLDLLMHGYGDTFTTAELDRNTGILETLPGWDVQLRDTGATVAVLRPTATLTYALINLEDWRVVHSSPTVVMLRAPLGWPNSR